MKNLILIITLLISTLSFSQTTTIIDNVKPQPLSVSLKLTTPTTIQTISYKKKESILKMKVNINLYNDDRLALNLGLGSIKLNLF